MENAVRRYTINIDLVYKILNYVIFLIIVINKKIYLPEFKINPKNIAALKLVIP